MDEELLSIGEVARRLGTSVSTIRYYDERGLVSPETRASGQRRYRPAEVRRLAFARMWQETGHFSLEDLRTFMAPATRAEWRAVARRRIADLEECIRAAQAAQRYIEWMLQCSRHDITECRVCGEDLDGWLALRARDENPDANRDENPAPLCEHCRAPLPTGGRGRPRRYCSPRCRQGAYRRRCAPAPHPRATTGKPVEPATARPPL
ncbi:MULTISPECIES: MerR family transcriptional regulator [Actinomadura]|uniref:MerR family transcriptional regulator n=1 Tax=Actinomadura yumaensis TaxID=111807 RepID=A0ABW2CJA7_9ACTN|nr:MerR family transcriptional regulator [Actinomadura sp. J1-007]MWK40117.1 MerR family transcriptional regulator [Actinomadura sp. J1-007]